MRLCLVAAVAVCLAMPATSQDDPFKSGNELAAEVARKCADGCVTFSREEAAQFEEALQRILAAKMTEAFQGGVQHQKAACASLI